MQISTKDGMCGGKLLKSVMSATFNFCSNLEEEWKRIYWKLCDMVVPNSSEKLYADGDYILFNVCLFQKVVDEFKLHARENKFIVREFVYNEKALAAGKNELNKLETDKRKQLVSWFSESSIHYKYLSMM